MLVKCRQCNKEFDKVLSKIKRSKNNFCSQTCLYKFNTKPKISFNCKLCNKKFTRKDYEIKKSENLFCSQHCAAKFNNVKNIIIKKCLMCDKKIKNNRGITKETKFCSHICYSNYTYQENIKKWKEGKDPGYRDKKTFQLKDFIRKYLFGKYNKKCCKCGWNKTNIYTGKIPLQIHHVDGNAKNNKEENLELLCPSCHSLTPNYGSRNNSVRLRSIKIV